MDKELSSTSTNCYAKLQFLFFNFICRKLAMWILLSIEQENIHTNYYMDRGRFPCLYFFCKEVGNKFKYLILQINNDIFYMFSSICSIFFLHFNHLNVHVVWKNRKASWHANLAVNAISTLIICNATAKGYSHACILHLYVQSQNCANKNLCKISTCKYSM